MTKASRREIRAAAQVNGLAVDVARARPAQEAHRRGDVLDLSHLAEQRVMQAVMVRLGAQAS